MTNSIFVDGEVSFRDILLGCSQTLMIVLIGFIHPWLSQNVPKTVKTRMQHSTVLAALFVFSFAFSYTQDLLQSIVTIFLYFYLRAALIKLYE